MLLLIARQLHLAVETGLVLVHGGLLLLVAGGAGAAAGAVGRRPLGGDLDAVREELHRAVAGDVAVSELAQRAVQSTEGEGLCLNIACSSLAH